MPTCLVRHARLLVTMDAQHREHRFGLELGREGASLGHCGSPFLDGLQVGLLSGPGIHFKGRAILGAPVSAQLILQPLPPLRTLNQPCI